MSLFTIPEGEKPLTIEKLSNKSSFKDAMSVNVTFTENGAISNSSTGNNLINFFFKTVRDTPESSLIKLLNEAWEESPLILLRLIFHLRDCRGGKAEKLQFYRCIRWLMTKSYESFLGNIEHVPFYGTWKDLLQILTLLDETQFKIVSPIVWKMFAEQLKTDQQRMDEKKPITLVGKWTPREKSKFDKSIGAFRSIRNELGLSCKDMRKLLVTLNKYLNTIEVKMCESNWDEIEYSKVPSRCMLLHRKAFTKHDSERFSQWLADVKTGKEKINARQIFPHELVGHYLDGHTMDSVIEEQWKALVATVKDNFKDRQMSIKNCLSICDVSGSMYGQPLKVSIALGILLSEITPEPFNDQIITFSSNPRFHVVKGSSLYEKVCDVNKMHWNMTTDFQKVFDMILNRCKAFNVAPEDMPQRLYVFSDMQFNSACHHGDLTNHALLVKKYIDSGFTPPQIVYWNLRGDTIDFPATVADSGVAMVSGFSPALMELFVDGDELSPVAIINKIVTSPRYKKIKYF